MDLFHSSLSLFIGFAFKSSETFQHCSPFFLTFFDHASSRFTGLFASLPPLCFSLQGTDTEDLKGTAKRNKVDAFAYFVDEEARANGVGRYDCKPANYDNQLWQTALICQKVIKRGGGERRTPFSMRH